MDTVVILIITLIVLYYERQELAEALDYLKKFKPFDISGPDESVNKDA